MQPKTFLIGITGVHIDGIKRYLNWTDQTEFLPEFMAACEEVGEGLALSSFYAKLCYKSLVLGKNQNVSKTRSIRKNVEAVMDSGHGAVFEHVWWNFVTTDCSRVFTHELVRHRVGTAFSQTSGRYVAIDDAMELVLPPEICDSQMATDVVQELQRKIISAARTLRSMLLTDDMTFAEKKRITSAIRRIAPNGQTNEIGWSANIRSLRHMIEMRTSRHAEWEIRVVFNQVATIIEEHCPLLLYGGQKEKVSGLNEWTNLRI